MNPTIHIRYDGQSFEADVTELDAGVLSTDQAIKDAVAGYLTRMTDRQIPASKLVDFVIDRNQDTGDITVRPPAVFA